MTNRDRIQTEESGIDTPSSTWGIVILGAVITLLWKTDDFTLWQSMIGIILVLFISALAERSAFTHTEILAYCAIKGMCYIIVFGVLIQLLLEALPSRDWKFTMHQFTIFFGQVAYFLIWAIFGSAIYLKERSRHNMRNQLK